MVLKYGRSILTVLREGAAMPQPVSCSTSQGDPSAPLSTSIAYVHSVMDVQNNLHLRCNARGCRVLFDANNKAIGVSYVPSRNRANGAQVQETIVSIYMPLPLVTIGNLNDP